MTERLYFADSFLREFDATVTEIQELSRTQGKSLWRVALDRSAFYPTGGGQPHDSGRLIATARSGAELAAEIVGVEEDEHDEVWHHTAKPLLPGTAVHGIVDRERRLDHIQQHSGQHLLSAAFFRTSGAATVSFHLGEQVSTIDLAVEKLPTEALERAESLANRVIAEDRSFTSIVVSRMQAEAWLASGELRKLPARSGDLRIVQIAGNAGETLFDRNACGGTHVRSSGQIGGLHVRGVEKVRDRWRVEFVCGLRAMRTARGDFHGLTEAARRLSVGLDEVPNAIQRMQEEEKLAAKKMQANVLELARLRAAEIILETPVENGLRLVVREFTPDDAENPAEIKLLASRVVKQTEKTLALFSWRPAEKSEPATAILAHSADLDFDCGSLLREVLAHHNGRGGGSRDMAQGSVPQEQLSVLMEALATKAKSLGRPS